MRSSKPEIKESHPLENQEALFLHYLEYTCSQATVQPLDPGTSSNSNSRDLPTTEAYVSAPPPAQVHECWLVQGHIDDDCCGTIDTGCQRSATGAETLNRLLSKQPKSMPVAMLLEVHQFRSVRGLSRTCIPTKFGPWGLYSPTCCLRGLLGCHAPLLLSLPFLLSCRSVLELDPEKQSVSQAFPEEGFTPYWSHRRFENAASRVRWQHSLRPFRSSKTVSLRDHEC